MVKRSHVAIGAALIAFALLPATASATFPGRNGMLVAMFSAYPTSHSSDPRATFEGIDSNGSARRIYYCTEFVGNCGQNAGNPSISSNGRELAFNGGIETDSYINQEQITLLRFGKFGLTLVPFTTSNENENDFEPAWIPGHNAFVFSVGGLGKPALDSEAPNGHGRHTVVNGAAMHAEVSPNGQTVLYDQGSSIWSASLSGGTPTEVVSKGLSPSWAPNGKRIAYVSSGAVYVSGAAGGGPRKLAPRGSDPVWSPDGKLIAYAILSGGQTSSLTIRIFTRPAGGGRARLLLTEHLLEGSSFGGMDWQALSG
jgi:Tol biopolymer transport system component